MNKYVKGKVVINATEKAYEILYKGQGFVPYEEMKTKEETKSKKNTKKKEEADK